MLGFFKRKKEKVFIIVHLHGEAYDYPQDMPLPRIGETVMIENKRGEVISVDHMIYGTFKEIRVQTI